VISHATSDFWRLYRALPMEIRKLARKNYLLWRANPRHPSLHFKKVGPRVWSARVGEDFRAVAAPIKDGYLWFWIGPHAEYERLITKCRRTPRRI